MVSEASPTSPEPAVLETDACIGLLQTSKITADIITADSNAVAEDLYFIHTQTDDVSDAGSDWFEMAEERKATLEGRKYSFIKLFHYPDVYDIVIQAGEFTAEPMDGPSFISCQATCGCVTCGCLLCSPQCLFSRSYSEPTFALYKVLQCSTWKTSLEIEVTTRIFPPTPLKMAFSSN